MRKRNNEMEEGNVNNKKELSKGKLKAKSQNRSSHNEEKMKLHGLHDDEWVRRMASKFPESLVFRAMLHPASLTWEEVCIATRLTQDAHIARDWTLANMMPDLPLKIKER